MKVDLVGMTAAAAFVSASLVFGVDVGFPGYGFVWVDCLSWAWALGWVR